MNAPTGPLRLQALGDVQVWMGEQRSALSGKSMAPLMYLALEGKSHRDTLTELLWTGKAALGARGNLRQELCRLRNNAKQVAARHPAPRRRLGQPGRQH